MIIKNQITVKILAVIIISGVIMTSAAVFSSCKPGLSFGDLVVCLEVDMDTFAPQEIGSSFGTGVKKIYAVIEVSGVKAEDVWKFTWKNIDTGEVIADSEGSYSEGDSGYVEGYLSNCIVPGEEEGIIGEPGSYRIDFYHNGQLTSSAGFIIEAPEPEIAGVVLSKEVDDKGKPVEVSGSFYPDDIINASVKLSYKKKDDSISVKWYRDEGELLSEEQFTIEDDYYLEDYVVFAISNDEPWPLGDYNLEVFYNSSLDGNYTFKVVRKEIPDAGFDQNEVYESEDYEFHINYPDGWSYEEGDIETGLEVVFVPEPDYIDVRIKMRVLERGYFPGKEEYSDFADSLVKDLDVEILDDEEEVLKTESSGEIDDAEYILINYNYPGENGNGWDIDLVFINKNSKLYLFLKISVMFYKEFADKVHGDMLDSLSFD
jgi:hypothetical protein